MHGEASVCPSFSGLLQKPKLGPMSINEPFLNRALEEAAYLQDRVAHLQLLVEERDDEYTRVEYFHTLYALVEKEHMIYTRLALSDDERLKSLIPTLDGYRATQTFQKAKSVFEFYAILKEQLRAIIKEMTGEDLEEIPPDLDEPR